MATVSIVLALALLAGSPFRTAQAEVDMLGYGQLVEGIFKANNNARACLGIPGCLGNSVTATITSDVTIVAELPPLQFNAFLIVKGACTTGTKARRCTVNGNGGKVFTSTPIGAPFARLEVSSLSFTNVSGGVFFQFWGDIIVRFCSFTGNKGGVDLAMGLEGGFPTRRFEDSTFTDNSGHVLAKGHESGWVYRRNGIYILKRCKLTGNVGTVGKDGGAISVAGTGYARIIDTEFTNNKAFGSGGALSLNASSARFYRCTFKGNVATSGRGMDIDGVSLPGATGNLVTSFCSSTFSPPTVTGTSSVSIVAPTVTGDVVVSVCNTSFPAGSKTSSAQTATKCNICTY